MPGNLTVILLIVAPLLVVLAASWLLRHNANWRPLLPWIIVTAFGAAVCTGAYWWFFETEGCRGRGDFVCLINKNQGFTTLVALLLAVAGLWVSKLTQEAESRAARKESIAEARRALDAAMGEVAHNLLHVALGTD